MEISLKKGVVFIALFFGLHAITAMEDDGITGITFDDENTSDEKTSIDKLLVAFQNHRMGECNEYFKTITRELTEKDYPEQVHSYGELIEHCAPKNRMLTKFFCHNLVQLCAQHTSAKTEAQLITRLRDTLSETGNCDALRTLARIFAHDKKSTDYSTLRQAIKELHKKGRTAHQRQFESHNPLIGAFAYILHENINSISFEKPEKLLDAVVFLNRLCRTVSSINTLEYQDLALKFQNFEETSQQKDEAQNNTNNEENAEVVFQHPLFDFCMNQAIKKTFKQNETIGSLIQIIVDRMAQGATPDNKEQLVSLLQRWLPGQVYKRIQQLFVDSFGWHDKENLRIAKEKYYPAQSTVKLQKFKKDFLIEIISKLHNIDTSSIQAVDRLNQLLLVRTLDNHSEKPYILGISADSGKMVFKYQLLAPPFTLILLSKNKFALACQPSFNVLNSSGKILRNFKLDDFNSGRADRVTYNNNKLVSANGTQFRTWDFKTKNG